MNPVVIKTTRGELELQAASNLIRSGRVPAENFEYFLCRILARLPITDLLKTFISSHKALEETPRKQQVVFWPYEPRNIHPN